MKRHHLTIAGLATALVTAVVFLAATELEVRHRHECPRCGAWATELHWGWHWSAVECDGTTPLCPRCEAGQ